MFRQKAYFHPRGLLGHLYWTAVYPFHGVVFGGMQRNIARAAERQQAGAPAPPGGGRRARACDTGTVTSQAGDAQPQETFFAAVGGHETFKRLVDRFYAGVAGDEPLKALYPEEDLGPAAERLTLFLEQYWGGPTTYSDNRGHPRLRMRHAPFQVNPDMRDRWLRHMRDAVDSLDLAPQYQSMLWDYLERAAWSMVNTLE